jgi:hypothetical protein
MSGFDQATQNLYSGSNASVNTSYRPESTAVSPKTNRCPTTSRVTFAIHDKIEPTNQRWTRNFYTTTHTNWPGLDKVPGLERMLGDLPEFHLTARTVEELDVKDGGKSLEVARSLNKGLKTITSAIQAIDTDVRVDRYYVDDNNGTIERMDGDDRDGDESWTRSSEKSIPASGRSTPIHPSQISLPWTIPRSGGPVPPSPEPSTLPLSRRDPNADARSEKPSR